MTHANTEHWVLVVNGELPTGYASELTQLLRDADQLVAVDGGLRHCADLGVWPTMVIGDLDSTAADLLDRARENEVEFRPFPVDKDATDLELAVATALDAGAGSLTVVAGFGGRLDHELATISLLASQRWRAMQVRATDGLRDLHIVHDRAVVRYEPGTTMSVIPWHGSAHGVTTRGMRWPLHDAVLAPGTTRGVSNVAVDSIQELAIGQGVLLLVIDASES